MYDLAKKHAKVVDLLNKLLSQVCTILFLPNPGTRGQELEILLTNSPLVTAQNKFYANITPQKYLNSVISN